MRWRAISIGGAAALIWTAAAAWAGGIDTGFLRPPWPGERAQELEVGRWPVRWRQRISRTEGLFTGVRFEAPLGREAVWDRAVDYQDVGRMTPGVKAVRFLEQSPTREVIQLDVQILWKMLTLTFEVERDPPKEIRFRLVHEAIGEFRGLCVLEGTAGLEATPRTDVELMTWFRPARPVPLGLLALVERIALLQGVKSFLKAFEAPPARR